MNEKRRNFISGAAAFSTLSAIDAFAGPQSRLSHRKKKQVEVSKKHVLPKLPYTFDALLPQIDARTVKLHYTAHHQGYVNGLNNAEEQLAAARAADDYSLIDYWTQKLSFHGAGFFLHNLYWNSMSPEGGGIPKGEIAKKMIESFGSFANFRKQFSKAAKTVEGSGWCILAYRPEDKNLLVLQVENHQKFTTWDIIPLMCIDVWEHAYYLKYQNRRAEYISAWFEVANWENANKNLIEASVK